ncbi:hypothetical protein [Saccharopolyspora taberi]|uniref:Uncharacterized protein n=1 Tax=Saccharopolyspora taberi TaxID=60895 RepID=A0ABN3VGP3_9PSEU
MRFTLPEHAPDTDTLLTSTEHEQRAMRLLNATETAPDLAPSDETRALRKAKAHLLACTREEKADFEDSAEREHALRHAFSPQRPPARIRVFHNAERTAMLGGYTAGHAVVEVYAYDEPDVTAETTDVELADRAFELFNVGDDPDFGEVDHRAREYRDRRNRSLSVGDVVAVDGRFHACAAAGWRPIAPPQQARITQPGTTPLH